MYTVVMWHEQKLDGHSFSSTSTLRVLEKQRKSVSFPYLVKTEGATEASDMISHV